MYFTWRNRKKFLLYPKELKAGSQRYFHGGSGLVAKLCPTLVIPWTEEPGRLQSVGFSRQEYWSGLPFPSPGDLPNPGIEPWVSCIVGSFFTNWATREAHIFIPMLITALFSIAKRWKQPRYPWTDGWMNKQNVVYKKYENIVWPYK